MFRISKRWLKVMSLVSALGISGGAWGAPSGGHDAKKPFSYDHFVRKGDQTFVQRENGMLTPLMDLRFLTEKPQIDAMEEARGEELKTESIAPAANPLTVNLSAYQTPIKDQQDRGTCWVFAIVAGIEARYKHDYALTLDLSEQYFNHVAKSTGVDYPRYYKYENQSSYWGGGNSGGVVNAYDYSIPLETYAPYKNQTQMDSIKASIPAAGSLTWNADPALNTTTQANVDAFEYSPNYIPASARLNALYGVTSYSVYNASTARSSSSLETLLASGKEVIIDVDLKWKYNSTTGIYDYDSTAPGAGHELLLIGYDHNQQYFLVKNSWGGSSYLKVSYNFFANCALGASVVNSVRNPNLGNDPKARFMGVWASDHDGWKGSLVIRRITNRANTSTRLGQYKDVYGGLHSVNGYSMDSDHGYRYYISSETENAPGTLTGQRFDVDQFSWTPDYTAGVTWSGNVPYGVALSRTALNAPYSSSFAKSEWVGTWNMNHDGWRGTLKITAVNSNNTIAATYTSLDDGKTYSVTGSVNSSYNHVLNFTIGYSTPQSFVLHYHTWDDKLASGYTTWNGTYFGAYAMK